MTTHFLKTWPEPFQAVWDGNKTYEIRRADRDFAVGDILVLQEYDVELDTYSKREIACKVIYMTSRGEWGIPTDLCIMAIHIELRKGSG